MNISSVGRGAARLGLRKDTETAGRSQQRVNCGWRAGKTII